MKQRCNPIYLLLPSLLLSHKVFSDDISILYQSVAPDFAHQQSQAVINGGHTLAQLAQQYLATQQANGHWSDIDYSRVETNEQPIRQHLDRLRVLAAADYFEPQMGYGQGAINAIYFWYSADRTNQNWWWNEIGKQLRLGQAALMLGNQLPNDLRQLIVNDMPTQPYKTGANRTDIAKAVIFGGLLSGNPDQVQSGLGGIAETIVVTEEEGVQIDGSFQQHGPQLYTGGYGEVFFDTAAFWAFHVRNLQWAFSAEQHELLASYFLDGVRWMNSHGTLDYNARGRGISRQQVMDKVTLAEQSHYISALAPQRTEEAQQFRRHVEGEPSGLQGFKHFWRSDYASKVADHHFIGVKMNSKRTYPTEAGNQENLRGNWIGFGSTFIMQKGDEYHNLFPVWNWALVPGVTAPQFATKPADWGKVMMQTDFVGGVSDGRYGVAVMDMDAYATQARKAWFSFDDEMVALGAGITSTRREYVNTTVNQTRLKGPVTVDGVEIGSGSRALVNASWVHHDGVGYVFPAFWYGHMDNQAQQGNWYDINRGQHNQSVAEDVFMLRIGHSWQPTNAEYQYIIVPNQTAVQTQAYAQQSPIRVLSNSGDLQVVSHTALQVTGAVFYQAGSATLADGSVISVNQPSVLLIDHSGAEPSIHLSTPGRGAEVLLTLQRAGKTQQTRLQTSSQTRWLGKEVKVDFSSVSLPSEPLSIMTT